MSAPEVLSPKQREEILTAHYRLSRREMVRYWTLSEEDLKRIHQRRRRSNRLGFAVQLCLLRFPGWPLTAGEVPSSNLVRFAATQLGLDVQDVVEYAQRDTTRREHLSWLQKAYGFRPYSWSASASLRQHLLAVALSTDSGLALVEAALAWLRERQVVVPALSTVESLVRSARSEAERDIYLVISNALTEEEKRQLDELWRISPQNGSMLGWLRRSPRSGTAAGILDLLNRLDWIRQVGLPEDALGSISPSRIRQLAARGGRHSGQHFRRFPEEKRYAILVSFLLYTAAELTDRSVEFHIRLMGRLLNRAEKRQKMQVLGHGQSLNKHLHQFVRLAKALVAAHHQATDLSKAVESIVSWDALAHQVQLAEGAILPDDFSELQHLRTHYPQVRQYAPKFLAMLEFESIERLRPLLRAVDVLRQLNREKTAHVPVDAPVSFVKPRWRRYVFTPEGLDRCYYELCVLSEVGLCLRSGDIWINSSHRFQPLESYLAPASPAHPHDFGPEANLPSDSSEYLAARRSLLERDLELVAEWARKDVLPEARLEHRRIVFTPLTRTVPENTEQWAERAYRLLPRIHLPALLQEVDDWTGFSRVFTHLYNGQPPHDRYGLLSVIIGQAVNLGISGMAEATQGYSAQRLTWINDWYVREQCYHRALAEIVRMQIQVPLSARWGSGRTSSSDGQAFPIANRRAVMAQSNAKYGRDPVITIYTHISDHYTPFHAKVIASTVRDATHVLDGLLNHPPDLDIYEHYTDTSGYTEHIFALCHLLGFRFAPRIRDLGSHRLYTFNKVPVNHPLAPVIGGRIRVDTIWRNWDAVLRLIASLRRGTASPSLLVSKLAAYPKQTDLALALREIGRLERTIFTLDWLKDPGLRRRVHLGLNKGEAQNSLKRAIRFHRRGSLNDRTTPDQDLSAGALNLVAAAITLWNTVYLNNAISFLAKSEAPVPLICVPHISPLGWEHITLTGIYTWNQNYTGRLDRLRPLRIRSDHNLSSWPA